MSISTTNVSQSSPQATSCNTLYLITSHEKDIIVENGYTILVIPVWEWLVM